MKTGSTEAEDHTSRTPTIQLMESSKIESKKNGKRKKMMNIGKFVRVLLQRQE